jgi:hypothetical protein
MTDTSERRPGRSFLRPARAASGLCIIVLLSGLAACGGASKSSPPRAAPAALEVAGPNPSVSAKMICADEAKNDIATRSVGFDTVQPLEPKWANHLYSCEYVYNARATMALAVKEMSSASETTSYFDALAKKLGRGADLPELGEGAFQTRNGSAVVRKDYRVLLVDVSGLPARFGKPLAARSDIAAGVAGVIMGCWIGA